MEHIHLDIVPKGITPISHASQFDNGRQIEFDLFNEGAAYTLDGTETITMVVNGVEEAVANTSDNYVVWDVDASDCEEAGVIECKLRIVKGGVKIGSKNFFLAVEADPYGAGPGLVIREAAGDPAEFTTNVSDDAVECKIDIGYNANGYLSATVINSRTAPAFDSVPYVFRKSGGDLPSIGGQEFDKLVGGTVAFNQLVQNGNFADSSNWSKTANTFDYAIANNTVTMTATTTLTRWNGIQNSSIDSAAVGHKLLIHATTKAEHGIVEIGANNTTQTPQYNISSGEWYESFAVLQIDEVNQPHFFQIRFGTSYSDYQIGESIMAKNAYAIDLTAMFGSTIADYIYSLEQATAGAGVAWFRKLFPNSYYPYDAGSLKSVKTTAHKMVGKNLLDYDFSDATSGAKYVQFKVPNGTYTMSTSAPLVEGAAILFFLNGYQTSGVSTGTNGVSSGTPRTVTVVDNYFTVAYRYIGTPAVYPADFNTQIEIGSQATPYEPYTAHTYTLDDVELRGLFKLDSNNKLYADGDTYESSGDVTRKYELLNLGSINWGAGFGGFYSAALVGNIKLVESSVMPNMLCSKKYKTIEYTNKTDKTISIVWGGADNPYNSYINILDSDYNDATALKNSLDGLYLLYEKATPTTETADTFTNPQQVDANGTEEYIDSRTPAIPVGHETAYGDDIKGVIVDFGQVIYGGELNLTTGTLTSTKNADGTDKATPDVYHLTPKQVEVRDGDNKIFGNTNGNTYVKYYARA